MPIDPRTPVPTKVDNVRLGHRDASLRAWALNSVPAAQIARRWMVPTGIVVERLAALGLPGGKP